MAKKFALVIKSSLWEGIFVEDKVVYCTSLEIMCEKNIFDSNFFWRTKACALAPAQRCNKKYNKKFKMSLLLTYEDKKTFSQLDHIVKKENNYHKLTACVRTLMSSITGWKKNKPATMKVAKKIRIIEAQNTCCIKEINLFRHGKNSQTHASLWTLTPIRQRGHHERCFIGGMHHTVNTVLQCGARLQMSYLKLRSC